MNSSHAGGVSKGALLLGSVVIAFSIGPCSRVRQSEPLPSLESRIQEDTLPKEDELVKRIFTPESIEAIDFIRQLTGNTLLDIGGKKRLGEYFMLLSDSLDVYFWYDSSVSLAREYQIITQPRTTADFGHTHIRPDVLLKVLAWKSGLGYAIDKKRQIIYVTQKDRPPY